MEEFRHLDRDIEGSAKWWKKFVESECPEKEIPTGVEEQNLSPEIVHDEGPET